MQCDIQENLSVLSLSGLYLCGHSAGAHLAAMVLSTDWSQYSITPQIKGEQFVESSGSFRRDDALIMNTEKSLATSLNCFHYCLVGAFLVSGIYDLLPILSTPVNEPLKMTE